MAEATLTLPDDSSNSGKKLRERSRSIGGNTVYEQYVALSGQDTWIAFADTIAYVASKQHISLFNGTGSGVIIKPRKLFWVDLQLSSVTGVAVRFDVKKTTAQSSGTAITPNAQDSNNSALPAQVLCATGATVTEGNILFPVIGTNDEVGATQAFPSQVLAQLGNWLMEGPEIQEMVLREGQGITVKQITSTTVGSAGWVLVFTNETP